MKIGIIGSGHIGATVAGLLVNAGREVAIANSRGPVSLSSLVGELGPKAHAMSVEEAPWRLRAPIGFSSPRGDGLW